MHFGVIVIIIIVSSVLSHFDGRIRMRRRAEQLV